MIDAVVVGAGIGKRVGGKYKQFFIVEGKPIIYYPVKQFFDYGVRKIILVVPEEKIQYSKEITSDFEGIVTIVQGGKHRQDSVLNGLEECRSDIILIHDGVRPFIKKELIDEVVKGVRKFGICAPGIPITETVKLFSKDKILWTINRKNLLQVQTPQGFRMEILKGIMRLLSEVPVTDELSIAESLNYEVHWVQGDPLNIKITYPCDLDLARIIAKDF